MDAQPSKHSSHSHHGHHGHHDHGAHDHHDHDHMMHAHGVVANIRIAFFLNLGFAILELIGGLLTNSMAIMTDALHDMGDAVALGLAWYLEKVSVRQVDNTFTYGYARFSVLSALINGFILILGAVLLIVETIPRLLHPEQADAQGMLYLAILGVAVNGFAAWRLLRGSSLNERVVALHLLEDVLGWVAIIIGAVVMLFWDVPILDPILSCAILVFILLNVSKSLKKAFRIFLQATPQQFDTAKIQEQLLALDGIKDIHDLHVWTLDGQFNIATLHAAISRDANVQDAEAIKSRLRAQLSGLGIAHATIEIESEDIHCVVHHPGGPDGKSVQHHDHTQDSHEHHDHDHDHHDHSH